MNLLALCFLGAASLALLFFPRRYAAIPLLMGACYMTLGQVVTIGPVNLTVLRILVAVGVVRVIVRREHPPGGVNWLDGLMLLFAGCALATAGFHADPMFSLGFAYNTCGIYFVARALCHTTDDAEMLVAATALVLLPVAIEMLTERQTQHNVFAVLGGVPDVPNIREGRLRAQGPFAHAILAGTVGAVCFPLMVGIWSGRRVIATVGLLVCVTMVVTSASSGPVASLAAAIAGLAMWKWRARMRVLRWSAVALYAALSVVMKVPPYYLLGRIDLAGGSTGWHRAELIDSALRHTAEWWRWGTDYTRHWMPTGVTWSPDHTDITNYYVHLGTVGGLPLLLAFLWVLARAFAVVGRSVRRDDLTERHRFMMWSFGAALFAHACSCISVSYFDQSFLFLYVNLAVIASTHASWASVPDAEIAPTYDDVLALASARVRRLPNLRRREEPLA